MLGCGGFEGLGRSVGLFGVWGRGGGGGVTTKTNSNNQKQHKPLNPKQ